jgi:hypothetical protein
MPTPSRSVSLSLTARNPSTSGGVRSDVLVAQGKFDLLEKAVTIDLTAYKDVWIFIEHEFGKVGSVSFELLGDFLVLSGQT